MEMVWLHLMRNQVRVCMRKADWCAMGITMAAVFPLFIFYDVLVLSVRALFVVVSIEYVMIFFGYAYLVRKVMRTKTEWIHRHQEGG